MFGFSYSDNHQFPCFCYYDAFRFLLTYSWFFSSYCWFQKQSLASFSNSGAFCSAISYLKPAHLLPLKYCQHWLLSGALFAHTFVKGWEQSDRAESNRQPRKRPSGSGRKRSRFKPAMWLRCNETSKQRACGRERWEEDQMNQSSSIFQSCMPWNKWRHALTSIIKIFISRISACASLRQAYKREGNALSNSHEPPFKASSNFASGLGCGKWSKQLSFSGVLLFFSDLGAKRKL